MEGSSTNSPLRERLAEQVRTRRTTGTSEENKGGSSPEEMREVSPSCRILMLRLIAFAIDTVALVAMGSLINIFFPAYCLSLGEQGWWIALPVAALYFTLLDSSIGGGRTLGKRIVGIEVRTVRGGKLNPLDAFLRFAPFGVVFATIKFSFLADQHSLIVVGINVIGAITLAGIVTMPFGHPEQRGMHDLLLDTFVLRSNSAYESQHFPLTRAWIFFLSASATICALAAGANIYLTSDPMRRLESILSRAIAQSIPEIEHVRTWSWMYKAGNAPAFRALRISAFVPTGISEGRGAIVSTRIRDKITNSGMIPLDVAQLEIVLRSGFDIGLYREMDHEAFAFHVISRQKLPEPTTQPVLRYRSSPGQSRRNLQKAPVSGAPASKPGIAPPTQPKSAPRIVTPTQQP